MAALARVDVLASCVLGRSTTHPGEHTWIDGDLGLVFGTFPSPSARYDFAKEKMVPIENTPAPKPVISLLGRAKRLRYGYKIETRQAIYLVGNATQALIEGLDLIEELKPGTMQKLSARKKRSKRPVAKAREDLYDYPHRDGDSTQLRCGYYVATNNKAQGSLDYLRDAASLAGLTWGEEFVVRA